MHTNEISSSTRVVITGASKGLGLALATAFRQRGAQVVGIARNEAHLIEAMNAIGGHALAADVGTTDPEEVAARANALLGGAPHLLVHAASTLGPLSADPEDPMPRLQTLSVAALHKVFATNTLGPAQLIRAFQRGMRTEGGAVVVISSDAATNAYEGWGAYGASKLALDHLVRVWAEEAPALRFLSFDPGEMDTAMHAAAMPSADTSTLASPEEAAARLIKILDDTGPKEASLTPHSSFA